MRLYAFDCVVGGQHHRGFMAGIDGPLLESRVTLAGLSEPIEPDQWVFDRVMVARASEGQLVQKVVRQVRKKGWSVTQMPPPPTRFFVFDLELDGGLVRAFTVRDNTANIELALRRLQLSKSGEYYYIKSKKSLGTVEIRSQNHADGLGIESLTRLVRNGSTLVVLKENDPVEFFENTAVRSLNEEMNSLGITIKELRVEKLVNKHTGENIMEDLRRNSERFSGLFLSHTSSDKPFARKLREDLIARGVKNVWFDEAEIRIGDSLIEKIQAGLSSTPYFAIVLSPRAMQSKWVMKELEFALHKEITTSDVFILPIVYEQTDLPPFLSGKLYADFSTPEKYEMGISQLLDRLALPSWRIRKNV